MTFVTTGLAIAGISAISIPIIVHLLFRQRRRSVMWAAMRFLMEAFRKHKRRLQLEQFLLLMVRCLVVALLGFALARPLLEGAGLISAGGSRAAYLVIDNGMISGLEVDADRTALDRHIDHAVELVRTLDSGDRVGIITASQPAQALLHPPSSDHTAVIDLLKTLQPKESPTDLNGAFATLRTTLEESGQTADHTFVYLLSEFRHGSAAVDQPLPKISIENEEFVDLLAVRPAYDTVTNVQVTSIEPVRRVILPGLVDGSNQFIIRLNRSGGDLANDITRVRLVGDGLTAVQPQSVSWGPGQTEAEVEFLLDFAAPTERQARISAVIDDDALNADNQQHVVVDVRRRLRVLMIDRRRFGAISSLDQLTSGQWIRRALEPLEEGPIEVVEVEPAALTIADLRTTDVAILPRPDLLQQNGWKHLRQFVGEDGLLIISPPDDSNVHQWVENLNSELGLAWRTDLEVVEAEEGLALAEDQPASAYLKLLSSELPDLARPVLMFKRLPITLQNDADGSSEAVLVFADGSPLLIASSPAVNQAEPAEQGAFARGVVLCFASAPQLAWTNLPSKPLMVPLFHELVRQGISVIRSSQEYVVGERSVIASGPSASVLRSFDGRQIALDQLHRTEEALEHAGLYDVLDPGGQTIDAVAVNVRSEAGRTDVQSDAAISAWLQETGSWETFDPENIGAALAGQRSGSQLAGLLLAMVLLLIIVETLIARYFSHAFRPKSTGSARVWSGRRRAMKEQYKVAGNA